MPMMPIKPLHGYKALVTSGPTHEPIDPVRYLANHSSGKQGHAIATALVQAGAEVTLVSGPVQLSPPAGVKLVGVTTAQQMLDACEAALPVDILVAAAAVCDWKPASLAVNKIKKDKDLRMELHLVRNVDIVANLAQHVKRPKLVIGFAAETENLLVNARAKRLAKGCDWLLANDVANGEVFNREENTITFITEQGEEPWPTMSKSDAAQKLVQHIAQHIMIFQKDNA